jgi:hypothetical protein
MLSPNSILWPHFRLTHHIWKTHNLKFRLYVAGNCSSCPSEVIRRPAIRRSRARFPSSRLGERAASKRSWTAVATLLTRIMWYAARQPLIQMRGSSVATLRDRPARCAASTTAPMSLYAPGASSATPRIAVAWTSGRRRTSPARHHHQEPVGEIPGLGRALADHRPLAAVSLVTPHPGLLPMQQLGQHRAVGNISRRGVDRMGNQWYVGMKGHFGVDSRSKLMVQWHLAGVLHS